MQFRQETCYLLDNITESQRNETCKPMEECKKVPQEQAVLLASLDAVISVVAFVGNTLIILVFKKFRHMRTPTNMFVIAIAVSDILTALTIPYYVSFYFEVPYKCNKIACAVRYLLSLYSTIWSLVLMIFLAMDRYLAVLHPLHYSSIVQRRRVRRAIYLSGVYIIFTFSVPFLDQQLYDKYPPIVECDLFYIVDMTYTMLAVCFPVALTIVVTTVFYWKIYREALRHTKTSPTVFHKRWETNMTIMMMLILGVHILALIPYLIVVIMRYFAPEDWQGVLSTVKKFTTVLYFAKSVANPFICALRNRGFRLAFRKTLGCGISVPRNDFSLQAPPPSTIKIENNGNGSGPVESIF